MKCVVATIRYWNVISFYELKQEDSCNEWILISDKDNFTYEKLKEIDPDYVFIPHWSWIIPPDIYENFNCILFHMTDLPYGRGGSPLQNLILRGHKETVISAIRVNGEVDGGDIILKYDGMSLDGPAWKIYRRYSDIAFNKMIPSIINYEFTQFEQNGDIVNFERISPEKSDISKVNDIEKIYDRIRMVDAEGYPNAYIEKDGKRFEFFNAELKDGYVDANVKIKVLK